MKVRKNLEAVFLAVAFVAVPASFAAGKVQDMHAAKAAAIAAAAAETHVPVVVVTGHRLSAAEKLAQN